MTRQHGNQERDSRSGATDTSIRPMDVQTGSSRADRRPTGLWRARPESVIDSPETDFDSFLARARAEAARLSLERILVSLTVET